MKKVLLIVLTAFFAAGVSAQNQTGGFDLSGYGVRIEPDRRLIVVLASLEAAGLEPAVSSQGAEFRKKMRADFEKLNPDLRNRMKMFVDQYSRRFAENYKQRFSGKEQQENFAANFERFRRGAMSEQERKEFLAKYPTFMPALVSPFISMAYTLAPVPDLTEPSRSLDLPDDLLEVLDYAPLVREFYRAAGFREKLDSYYKDYQAEGDKMRPSAVQMTRDLLDYLHTRPQTTYIERVKVEAQSAKNKKNPLQNTELRERERRFYIVPEMLAPAGTVNFRNIGDEYFAIVPPATDLSDSETRRAFLQFVIDPLVLNNAKDITAHSAGIRALLEERRKTNPAVSPDIFLAVSRSLIAAIDAKEAEYRKTQIDATKGDVEKRKVSAELETFKRALRDETALQLSAAYENGAVLAFYFAKQLDGLTESGFDIAGSLREMILSLDAAKEAGRLEEFAEARTRAEKSRAEKAKTAETILENPVTKRLLGIEEIIKTKNYADADKQLANLLNEVPNEAPRIYYTRGRVASLSAEAATDVEERKKRLQEAQIYYSNVIRSATAQTDPALLSLSYVALGRIHEFFGESEYAVKIYEAAIRIGNVGESFKEAQAARERLMKEQ
jgi:hypothetical protein